MPWLWILASLLLAAITLWDVFITLFNPAGAGPLTQLWTRPLWACLLWIHRRRRIHRVLSLTGPFVLVVSILLWYALLGLSVLLALGAYSSSVVHGETRAPATLLEKFYFVTTTISSLGYGDLTPTQFPWTILSTTAALAGTVIITISLSYVLSVLDAAIARRKLAKGIFGLGTTSAQIIERARLHDAKDSLKPYILSLASEIDDQALKQLAYPILKFFHSVDPESVPARALLLLANSFFLLESLPEERRAPPGVSQLVWSSIKDYAQFRHASIVAVQESPKSCPRHLVESARALGITTEQSERFHKAWEDYRPLHTLLVTLCREEGWEDASHDG